MSSRKRFTFSVPTGLMRNMTQSQKLLGQIIVKIQKINALGHQALVVFDLDSTLFDVNPRLDQILLDFAANLDFQKQFPEQVNMLKNIKTLRGDWGIKNALQRIGLDGQHPEFEIAIHEFWKKTFFSNSYLHYDVPYEGAVNFVQALAHAGADIAYLTGRDIERMGVGSIEVLKKWNFPLNESQYQLVLKPHRSMNDADFKTNWFLSKTEYEKVWFFENEPINIHSLQEKRPEIEIIFLDTTHAGKASPPENIPQIMDFLFHFGDE